jgi:hypothetical protein
MSKLRRTSKSSTKLADDLVGQGFEVSPRSALRLLPRLDSSLQANAKVKEGRQRPDRDAQFRYLNAQADSFVDGGQPVISVDKKKELLGNYANGGVEWAPVGGPERVEVRDFADRRRGLQRLPAARLKSRAGSASRRDRPGDHRLPLPARNLQVEPDRAPHVQLLRWLLNTGPLTRSLRAANVRTDGLSQGLIVREL